MRVRERVNERNRSAGRKTERERKTEIETTKRKIIGTTERKGSPNTR